MDNHKKTANKKWRVAITAIFLACTAITVVFFFCCIRDYFKFDEDNLNFTQEKLTYEKHQELHDISGWYFVLHFMEYEEPFRIFTVTSKAVNEANLKRLTENDILDITFCKEFDDICEISRDGMMILSLSDYIKANKNNQIMGIICCSLFFLGILFLAWLSLRAIEPISDNGGLGKLRIEYIMKGNVIQVYHSIDTCSLVINGQIFDRYYGVYGSNFCLKGRIGIMKAGGKTIHVEAKMGFCNMCLYCNGKLVAKKFMVFG